MANYICEIWSNSSNKAEYTVTTKSAMRAAAEYGRAEGGEVVQVRRKSGAILSRVEWYNREYIRVEV